jgi:polysaccharide pyruvyl transferase WcaK-like protein
MRLHSMILSAVHGIPFLALEYGTKTHELTQILEWKYRTNAREATHQDLWAMIEHIESHYEEVREKLQGTANTLRQLYRATLERLLIQRP